MLIYEQMKAFADLLAQDQAPDESGDKAFDSKRYIYSITFENNVIDQAVIKVHCQWEVLKEWMRNHPCDLNCHAHVSEASHSEAIHINATDTAHPELNFIVVIFAWELKEQTDNPDRTLKELFDEWLEKQGVQYDV